jgi:signal transduction histidine kinase
VVYQDKTGIIWLGTFNGLNKQNPLQQRFRHLTANADVQPSLMNNFVMGIYAGSGNTGLIRYINNAPFFSEFDLPENLIHHYLVRNYNFADLLKKAAIKNSGYLSDDTLNKFLPFLKRIRWNFLPPGSLMADKKQGLWFNEGFKFWLVNTSESWSFQSYNVDMQINGDDIWLATAGNGLLCFHVPTRTLTRYIAGDLKKGSINSNDITCFIIEQNGNMWIGTKGGGLNYFDIKKKTFQHYTEEDGLCNNSIYSLVKDNNSLIWIGTSNGLSCFDPVTHKFSNYFRSDGLVNSEYNRYSACKLENGFLLMGGMNGIDYFHPDSLLNNRIKPQVQITDFKVFNKSIYPGQNFSLGYNKNSITIYFAAMDFSNPTGNKFAYKLEGVDKDWVTLEKRNFATYSILSPGSYHFSVKAANSDGIWNDDPQTIEFTILTPWWQSKWFYTFCALAIIMLLVAFYRYRINQLKKIMAIRTRISQDLHDDIGASLSSINIYSSVAERAMDEDVEKTKNILQKINHNTRKVMEDMSDIVWAMNNKQKEESTFSNRIKNYGYDLLSQKNIECRYQIDEQAEQKLLKPEARKNILLIVKEAMNNIAKYSEASRAEVQITKDTANIEIKITDNGKGFDPDTIVKGNGLKNIEQRSALLGGSCRFDSSPGRGTTIQCKIPVTNISDR